MTMHVRFFMYVSYTCMHECFVCTVSMCVSVFVCILSINLHVFRICLHIINPYHSFTSFMYSLCIYLRLPYYLRYIMPLFMCHVPEGNVSAHHIVTAQPVSRPYEDPPFAALIREDHVALRCDGIETIGGCVCYRTLSTSPCFVNDGMWTSYFGFRWF